MKQLWITIALLATASSASAQGWALNRLSPAPAGDRSVLAQDPWYDGQVPIAAALTLDYANRPLALAREDGSEIAIVDHALTAHVQTQVVFLDRVGVTLALPVSLFQAGSGELAGTLDAGDPNLGDVGVGFRGRIFGHANADAFSLHAHAELHLPLAPVASRNDWVTDDGVRFRGGLVAAGTVDIVRWSAGLAYHVRPRIETPYAVVDDDLQGTIGVTLVVVPDLLEAGIEGALLGVFETAAFGAEALAVGHLTPHENVRITAAVGPGFGDATGIPRVRALLRAAYVPSLPEDPTRDTDADGVIDIHDDCPDQEVGPNADPSRIGCPAADQDVDGIPDHIDPCPEAPPGPTPDPTQLGCPERDGDGDGIPDRLDPCPEENAGPNADPSRAGCPSFDTTVEGNPDRLVPCAERASGPNVDPSGEGCPQFDVDGDGVSNEEDQCADQSTGPYPDPTRAGCPAPDGDGDQVPDANDACPDRAGAPHPDAARNGCPGLVAMDRDELRIQRPIYFGSNSDEILRRSNPVLQAVADALVASPHVTRVVIEGHTDNEGDDGHNMELSQRRAESVARWLSEHGVDASRLVPRGFGETRPIVSNETPEGRAENRRVEFNLRADAQ